MRLFGANRWRFVIAALVLIGLASLVASLLAMTGVVHFGEKDQGVTEGEVHKVKDPEGRTYVLRVIEDDNMIANPIREGNFWEAHFLPKFKEYVEASLRPGDVILDIGANIGSHSVYLSNFADVYAFEPQDLVLRVLRWNAANNKRAHRIHVMDFGLYSESKTLHMNPIAKNEDGTLNFGGTGMRQSSGPMLSAAGEEVRVRKFDEFWPEQKQPRVGFIKIDIEGGETEALVGMTDMLRRDAPLIQFEDWGEKHPNGKPRPKDVLEPLGYCINPIDDHNWLAVPPRLAQRFECAKK
jgi:FkbM family methyltransferase